MLPRALMLTIKNAGEVEGEKSFEGAAAGRSFAGFWAVLILCAVVASGCRPPGPRALLDGQRLIERGDYAKAVDRLRTATSLLSTNAQAWNYLGLAYHLAGQPADAADAYKKALSLDQNLVEVHYNLGCLWLEQNRPDLARAELTAFTLHRGDRAPEGWIKLGEAQLALRDLTGAERSLNEARQVDAQNPEALNDMGVVLMQRNRAMEAAQYFNGALHSKPDYAPAILNLAIVSQRLGNRQYALERYRDYLQLKPRPGNWDEVDAAARALEQELSPATASAAPATARPAPPAQSAPSTPVRATSNGVARTQPPKTESTAPGSSRPVNNSSAPVQVTQVTPEPVIRAAQDASPARGPEPAVAASPKAAGSQPERRSFLSRVNPANLFRSNKTEVKPANNSQASAPVAPMPQPVVNYPRYHYRNPRRPAAGDRAAAERAFTEGSQAQQAGQLTDAMADYRKATQADPGYFDPYYNLGIVSMEAGNLQQALQAYETALVIEPDSHDARFNFALVLRRANYPLDAVNELEKVLAKAPDDANAHYALANIYVKLRDNAKARDHYQKVLDLNPSFPEAAAIHQWLWANPG